MMKKLNRVFSAVLSSTILLSAAATGSVVTSAAGEETELVPSRALSMRVGTTSEYIRLMREVVKDDEETKNVINAVKNYAPSADNSKDGYFPLIKTQGAIGSCGAWAGVYYTYTHEMNRHLKRKTTEETTFNPLFIYNLHAGGFQDDHGINPWQAYEIIGSSGVITCATNDDITGDFRTWNPTFESWREASNYRLTACFDFENPGSPWSWVTSPDDTDLDAIKAMLRSGHVTSFCGYINSFNYSKLKASDSDPEINKGVVGEQVITSRTGYNGYHAMTIVGYDDTIWTDINNNNKVDKGEMGALKIANSWDVTWRNKGFCWVAYDALNTKSLVEGIGYQKDRGLCMAQICMPVMSKDLKSSNIYLKYTLNSNNRKDSYLMIQATKKSDGSVIKCKTLPQFLTPNQNFALNYNYEGKEGYGDGTFIVDLDNIIPDINSDNFNDYSWSVSFFDGDDGNPLTVKEAVIVDENTGDRFNFDASFPFKVNNASKTVTMMPLYNISRLAYSPKSNVTVNSPLNISFTAENEVRYNDKIKYQIDVTRDGKLVYRKQTKAAKTDASKNTSTVALKWTPVKSGTYTITASAVDATGASAKRSTTVKVFPENFAFRSLTLESNNEIGGTYIYNYEKVKIVPKVTGGTAPFQYSYYYTKSGKTYKLAENTKNTSWTKTFGSNCGDYTFTVKVKDSTGKTVSMSKKITVGRTRIRGLEYSNPWVSAGAGTTIFSKSINIPDVIKSSLTYVFTFTDPSGKEKVVPNSKYSNIYWTPDVNGVHKVKLEILYDEKTIASYTEDYKVGGNGQEDNPNYYVVKVNVINYICNEFGNNSSYFQMHYWNLKGMTGDAPLTPLNKNVTKNVGYWSSAQTFKQFTANIPKTATGYKFHIGDRWFGSDGNLSTTNSVYVFNYSGDKATYCKE